MFLGPGGEFEAQFAPCPAGGEAHGPCAVPVAGAEQLPGDEGAAQVDVRVVFPGEADAAEDLDAVLGAGVGGVEGGAGGQRGQQGAHVGRFVRGPGRVPDQGAGLFEAYQHVGAQVFDALEPSDGSSELLARLRVLGGGVDRPGGGAAGVGGEEDAGQVPDQGGVEGEEAAGGDGDRAGAHLGRGPGRVGALVGADVQGGGVHGEPVRAVGRLGGEQDEVGLPGAEHGRCQAVEEVAAALDGDGGHAAGAQRDGPHAGAVGEGGGRFVRSRPVQQDGGQGAGEVGAGQGGPGGLLHGDGEVEQAPALQVGCEQSGGGERVPVGGPHPGPGRAVEQFAHLLGWHGPRRPAAHGLGQLLVFPRDSDAHTNPCRLSDAPGRRRSSP